MSKINSKEEIPIEWKDIRSEKIRKFLIDRYLKSLIYTYKLTAQQSSKLETLVHLALLRREIDKTHVESKNGRIITIRGLKYNEDKQEFELDETIIKRKKKVIEKDSTKEYFEIHNINSKISFAAAWANFIQNFNKNSQTSSKSPIKILDNSSDDNLQPADSYDEEDIAKTST